MEEMYRGNRPYGRNSREGAQALNDPNPEQNKNFIEGKTIDSSRKAPNENDWSPTGEYFKQGGGSSVQESPEH
jgi:hypothetical protein